PAPSGGFLPGKLAVDVDLTVGPQGKQALAVGAEGHTQGPGARDFPAAQGEQLLSRVRVPDLDLPGDADRDRCQSAPIGAEGQIADAEQAGGQGLDLSSRLPLQDRDLTVSPLPGSATSSHGQEPAVGAVLQRANAVAKGSECPDLLPGPGVPDLNTQGVALLR